MSEAVDQQAEKTKDTQLKRALETITRLKAQVTELSQATQQVGYERLFMMVKCVLILLLEWSARGSFTPRVRGKQSQGIGKAESRPYRSF